ncbi:hypothetical protein ACLK19_22940 [Escherichia coli]
MAKHIIHLIDDVAKVINDDKCADWRDKLKVVSSRTTALRWRSRHHSGGQSVLNRFRWRDRASGTSNMKFALKVR